MYGIYYSNNVQYNANEILIILLILCEYKQYQRAIDLYKSQLYHD